MKRFDQIPLFILLCLTLGLAPFRPEPHIWGKLKWIAGGAVGMGTMDCLDFVLHGTPWVLLAIALVKWGIKKVSPNQPH
ncbi:MAG: hypothetical protein AAF399_23275 [Bacteroidota bacterium]